MMTKVTCMRMVLALLMAVACPFVAHAQVAKPYYDAFVFERFSINEGEIKTVNRTIFNSYLYKETGYADTIDSLYTTRLKDLLIETGERFVDAQWVTEQARIERQLDKMQKNVNLIRTMGGSQEDLNNWKQVYNMIAKNALSMVHDSYQPGYKRMEEYQNMYADLVQYNARLSECFRTWSAMKFLEQQRNGEMAMYKSRLDSIAGVCLGRWRLKVQNANESSPRPKKLRNVWEDN